MAVYGGIELTDNIKEFLKLPAKFRIYGRIEKVQADLFAEEGATMERWDIRDRKEREEEGQRMSPDQLRNQKDKEYLARKACTSEIIDLGKIRATDLPSNKEIHMPGPANLKEEMEIQRKKQIYLDVVRNYKANKCDNKGNCAQGDNLTPKERTGLDEIKYGIKKAGWMIYHSDKS